MQSRNLPGEEGSEVGSGERSRLYESMRAPSQNGAVVCAWRCSGGGESVPFITSEQKFVTWILEPVLPPVLQVLNGLLSKRALSLLDLNLHYFSL